MSTVNEMIEERTEERLDAGGLSPFSVVYNRYDDTDDIYQDRALYWFNEALDRESLAQSAEDLGFWQTAKRHREAAQVALGFARMFEDRSRA